jgi:hypothetical protein
MEIKNKHADNEDVFVWPQLAFMEFLTAVALTVILIVWSLLINAPLLEIASPGISENPSRAPWYFVGLQELLVYFDPWIAGFMIPVIIIICLMIIPYLDADHRGSGEYNFSVRRFAVTNFIFGFSMWLVLILIGYYLRGPNWQFYWPWESLDTIKHVSENLWSPGPAAGTAVLGLYFGLGMALPRYICKEFCRRCGLAKYLTVMFPLLLMYFVPIKILLRIVFNIRYVLVTPWFNV